MEARPPNFRPTQTKTMWGLSITTTCLYTKFEYSNFTKSGIIMSEKNVINKQTDRPTECHTD